MQETRLWDADRGYDTGNVATASGTWTGANPQLYATERWDPAAAPDIFLPLHALEPVLIHDSLQRYAERGPGRIEELSFPSGGTFAPIALRDQRAAVSVADPQGHAQERRAPGSIDRSDVGRQSIWSDGEGGGGAMSS